MQRLAALAAEENLIDKLILWEPVIDGAAYMREMLRINLATQSSVYREIRLTTEALIERMKMAKQRMSMGTKWPGHSIKQAAGNNLLISVANSIEGRTLIVQINKKDGPLVQRMN